MLADAVFKSMIFKSNTFFAWKFYFIVQNNSTYN